MLGFCDAVERRAGSEPLCRREGWGGEAFPGASQPRHRLRSTRWEPRAAPSPPVGAGLCLGLGIPGRSDGRWFTVACASPRRGWAETPSSCQDLQLLSFEHPFPDPEPLAIWRGAQRRGPAFSPEGWLRRVLGTGRCSRSWLGVLPLGAALANRRSPTSSFPCLSCRLQAPCR